MARSRQAAPLEALWRAWHRDVLRYAQRRTDFASAQDIVSDTFIVAERKLAQVPAEPLPWLLAIARGLLANQQRGARRRERLAHLLGRNASPPLEHDRAGRELLEALSRLPDLDREALLLIAWEGLSASQAAEVLGCTPNAFNVRIHRARKRLQHLLEPDDETPPTAATMEQAR
jgi:RNA polymerase sigma factor (sigma-70 family)